MEKQVDVKYYVECCEELVGSMLFALEHGDVEHVKREVEVLQSKALVIADALKSVELK